MGLGKRFSIAFYGICILNPVMNLRLVGMIFKSQLNCKQNWGKKYIRTKVLLQKSWCFHASQSSVCLTGSQSTFACDTNISYYWGHRIGRNWNFYSTILFIAQVKSLQWGFFVCLFFLFCFLRSCNTFIFKNPWTLKLLLWGLFPSYLCVIFIWWTCSLYLFNSLIAPLLCWTCFDLVNVSLT